MDELAKRRTRAVTDLEFEPIPNQGGGLDNRHLVPPIERRGSASIKDDNFIVLLGGYDDLYIDIPITSLPIGESGNTGTFIDTPIIFSATTPSSGHSERSVSENSLMLSSPGSPGVFNQLKYDPSRVSSSDSHRYSITRKSSISQYSDMQLPLSFNNSGPSSSHDANLNSGLLLALPNEIWSTRSLFSDSGNQMVSSPTSFDTSPSIPEIEFPNKQSHPPYQEWKSSSSSIKLVNKETLINKQAPQRVLEFEPLAGGADITSRLRDLSSKSLDRIAPNANTQKREKIRSTSFNGMLRRRKDRTGREAVEKMEIITSTKEVRHSGIFIALNNSLARTNSRSRSWSRALNKAKGTSSSSSSSIIETPFAIRASEVEPFVTKLPDIFVSEFQSSASPVLLFSKPNQPHVEVTISLSDDAESPQPKRSQLKRRTLHSKPEKLTEIDKSLGDLLNEDVPDPDAEDKLENDARKMRRSAIYGPEDEGKRQSFLEMIIGGVESFNTSSMDDSADTGSPSSPSMQEKRQSRNASKSTKRMSRRVPDMPLLVNRQSNIPDAPLLIQSLSRNSHSPEMPSRHSTNLTIPDFRNPQVPAVPNDNSPSQISVKIEEDNRNSHLPSAPDKRSSQATVGRRKSRLIRKIFSGLDENEAIPMMPILKREEPFIMPPEIIITPADNPVPPITINPASPHRLQALSSFKGSEDSLDRRSTRMRRTSLPTETLYISTRTFRSLPRWITSMVKVKTVARICLALTWAATISNIILSVYTRSKS